MARGYSTAGDILTQTADGRDLNALWDEFQQVVAIYNAQRQKLIDFLTFPVTTMIEDVPQFTTERFEKASEFGVPVGVRSSIAYWSLGYSFDDFDIANRFTWKFLRDASSNQVEAIHQIILDADSRNIYTYVMNALFRNTDRSATINGQNYNVYALYNADGIVPPAYGQNIFDGTHTHYRVSGGANVDSGDLAELALALTEHGYSPQNGTTLLLLVNTQEANIIRTFRANTANNNGATSVYDFVPSTSQPALIVPNSLGLLGSQPSGTYDGLNVIGAWGQFLVIEEDAIPAGYMVAIGSGGIANLQNPVGLRQHPNSQYQGLRLLGGDQTNYPLVNAYYQRSFGTGIRQRGAAAIMQVKASGAYVIPAAFTV